jgi:hypothetical protein
MLMTVKPLRPLPTDSNRRAGAGRWQQRALRAVESGEQHAEDYVHAFCQNAYQLRDWLQNSGAASQRDLDELMARTPALKLCRDVWKGQSISSWTTDAPRPTTSDSWVSTFHRP